MMDVVKTSAIWVFTFLVGTLQTDLKHLGMDNSGRVMPNQGCSGFTSLLLLAPCGPHVTQGFSIRLFFGIT